MQQKIESIKKMHNMTWLHQIFPDYEIVLEYDDIDNKTLPKEEIHGIESLPSYHPQHVKNGNIKHSDDNNGSNANNNNGSTGTTCNTGNTSNTDNNAPLLFCLSCHKPSSEWTKKDIAHAISDDKEEFDAILGRMKSEALSENEREVCLSALEKIATKYQ